MNIILTDIANFSIFIIPIVPKNIQIVSGGNSTTYNGIEHQFTVIDNEAPKEIGWSSFFPVNKTYNFVPHTAHQNGWVYVEFIKLMEEYMLSLRVIYTTNNHVPVLNMLAKITTFNYTVDKAGDINYAISLTEFPETFFEYFGAEEEKESTEIQRAKKIWEMIKKDYADFKENFFINQIPLFDYYDYYNDSKQRKFKMIIIKDI